MESIYTVGHSNHQRERFLELLRGAGVSAVADVRSKPFSRRHPQFSRPALAKTLADAGIAYVFLGEELGGQPADAALLRDGAPDYERMAASAPFRRGLDRAIETAGSHRLAIMCAEREPLECHRFLLVSRHLALRGARIAHILADGTIEEHGATVQRLLRVTRLGAGELFAGEAPSGELLAQAYAAGHRRLFGRSARSG